MSAGLYNVFKVEKNKGRDLEEGKDIAPCIILSQPAKSDQLNQVNAF